MMKALRLTAVMAALGLAVTGLSACASGAGDSDGGGFPDRVDPPDDGGALCGNGLVDPGEECDSTELLGATCDALGYTGGDLSCRSDCRLDKTRCEETPCGNGMVDAAEECDGADLVGQSCEGLGFVGGGELRCGADCLFATDSCRSCGDGVVDEGEECDGENFGVEDCITRGFTSGTLACDAECGIDTSSCVNEACGNGMRDEGEDCDGVDLDGASCETVGAVRGMLSCNEDCTFNSSLCTSCGNGRVDTGESCDGEDLAGEDCASRGFTAGTLRCSPACEFITTACTSTACGNGVIEGGEMCDDRNTDGGDGCSSECEVEDGWTCDAMPSACDPVCGDGMVLGAEECDGSSFGDVSCESRGFTGGSLTCSPTCFIDTTTCTTETCGNGTIEVDEECDDGNTTIRDGCDAGCQVEDAFYLPVRLTGGEGSNHGRLEVRFEGAWRDICDDTSGVAAQDAMADVVCAQLGYTGTGHEWISRFGGGSDTPLMDDVQCTGDETSLAQCPFDGWEVENCTGVEAVGIRCTPGEGDVRLVDGPNGLEGRLQYFNGGAWGEVCDDFFDGNYTSSYLGYSTTTVCQQLGYADGVFLSTYDAPGDVFVLDDVNCTGTERRIGDCRHPPIGVENCTAREGAGFRCAVYDEGEVRLVGGSNRANGRVEILHDNLWGTICDDFITSGIRGDNFVTVGCTQLGFDGAGTGLFSVPAGEDPIWLDDLDCDGTEPGLANCGSRGWGMHNCVHAEDSGLSCTP